MTDFGATLISGLDFRGGIGNATEKSTFISDPIKGDGLLHRANGQHTLQIIASNFTGNVSVEATMNKNPDNAVWTPVPLVSAMNGSSSTELIFQYTGCNVQLNSENKPVNINEFFTITGQYSWLRANISGISNGILQSMKIAI